MNDCTSHTDSMSTTPTPEQIAIAALIELGSRDLEIREPKIVEIRDEDDEGSESDGEICFLEEEPLSMVVKYEGNAELCLLWMVVANLELYEPGLVQMMAKHLIPKGWTCHLTPVHRILGDGARVIYDKNYFYNPVSGLSQWSPVSGPIEDFKLSVRCCATCSMPLNPDESYCGIRSGVQKEYHRMIDLRPGDEKRTTYLPITSKRPKWRYYARPRARPRPADGFVSFNSLFTEGREKSMKLYHELNRLQLTECLERNGVKREKETWRECARRFRVTIRRSNPMKYELQEILRNIRLASENIKRSKPKRPQANTSSWLDLIETFYLHHAVPMLN